MGEKTVKLSFLRAVIFQNLVCVPWSKHLCVLINRVFFENILCARVEWIELEQYKVPLWFQYAKNLLEIEVVLSKGDVMKYSRCINNVEAVVAKI